MADATDGTGPAAEGAEDGAQRHPTDVLGSQGGSQGTPPDGVQSGGDTPPADNADQGAKTITDPELPEMVRRAIAADDPTNGWAADDERSETGSAAPMRPRGWKLAIIALWVLAALVVSILISLAVQNGEEEKKPTKKPVVAAKQVPAKSDKDKAAAIAVKATSFTVLARRDETLELYAKWVKASVDDVLKWNSFNKTRTLKLKFGSAVVLYATPENQIHFEEARRKYHEDKRDAFNTKYLITGYQKVKVEFGGLAALEALYSAPAWLLDRINPYLDLDNLEIGDEVTVPRVIDRSAATDGIKVAVSGGVQPPTDIMVVDPNAPDTVSGSTTTAAVTVPSEPSTSSTAPVEGNTVVTPAVSSQPQPVGAVAVDGAIVPSGAVVGLAAGASEQAVTAKGTADEAMFRVTELEAKVVDLQHKLDEAIMTGAADAEKLRKDFEAAKAELAKARATIPVSPPAPSTPPPVSTGSGATGSSAATHLLVDPATYLKFCLKYGGTQEGCDRTLKDLQQ